MIKSAAIKYGDKICLGRNHADIMASQEVSNIPHDDTICGFADDKGNFLTREEAFEVAQECDQLLEYYKHYDSLQSYMLKK